MQHKPIPTLAEEEKLWRQGRVLIGVDEAGRGPLAGPVVAAAVVVLRPISDVNCQLSDVLELGVNDSKKLTPKKREEIFEKLTNLPSVWWAVGIVHEKAIDKINILQASLLAMRKAASQLVKKCRVSGLGEYIIYVDGREVIPLLVANQKAVIGGDGKIFSIAAASIIAKVTRDRIMSEYAKKYPQYGFEKHKGYGTKLHFEMIKKYGLSLIHRKSFLKNLH